MSDQDQLPCIGLDGSDLTSWLHHVRMRLRKVHSFLAENVRHFFVKLLYLIYTIYIYIYQITFTSKVNWNRVHLECLNERSNHPKPPYSRFKYFWTGFKTDQTPQGWKQAIMSRVFLFFDIQNDYSQIACNYSTNMTI